MTEKVEKARFAILKVLSGESGPAGATHIRAAILSMGVNLQPRMVRQYLAQLDDEGLTRLVSRRLGREITASGRTVVAKDELPEMAQIIASRVDELGYRMTFDSAEGKGTVVVNVSFVHPHDLTVVVKGIQLVLDRGDAFGDRIIIMKEGGSIGSVIVPEGMVGIGTVCSITLNGVLQKAGIPVVSRFGGLLEVQNRRYVRFMNIIEYRGSSLDPLEVFIRAEMTRVRDVLLRGSGIICASFREIPAVARSDMEKIGRRMQKFGMAGVMAVGKPSQPLFGVPVSTGYCGVIVAGGLNPIAAVCEAGIRVVFQSLAGLEDYSLFKPVRKAYAEYTGG